MKEIDGSNWITYSTWRLMSHNAYYRHYVKRTNEHEENLIIIRTSDQCYRCTRWRVPFSSLKTSIIEIASFRSWINVVDYSKLEIGCYSHCYRIN